MSETKQRQDEVYDDDEDKRRVESGYVKYVESSDDGGDDDNDDEYEYAFSVAKDVVCTVTSVQRRQQRQTATTNVW